MTISHEDRIYTAVRDAVFSLPLDTPAGRDTAASLLGGATFALWAIGSKLVTR